MLLCYLELIMFRNKFKPGLIEYDVNNTTPQAVAACDIIVPANNVEGTNTI